MTTILAAARAEALFLARICSGDLPDSLDRAAANTLIADQIRVGGSRGCARQVAQEFGDHPDTAADRMRWALDTVDELYPARH